MGCWQFLLLENQFFLISYLTPKARGREILQRPPSVCLSVRHVWFSHCNSKTHWSIFSKLCRYVHHVMGVGCVVFDIGEMLFEFFKYWKKIKFKFLFSIFHVFFAFDAISNIKQKFSFHFAFYAIFNITIFLEKCPFTYWLNGRWFLKIEDSGNLYPIYILYSLVLIFFISNVEVVWGSWEGVMFFLHFILFPTFLEKLILGIKNNNNLNFFF